MTELPDDPAALREFLGGDAVAIAPRLLGWVLTHAGVSVRLTEVEAYAGDRDPGSHAYRGRTARNATMFGPAGHLYVYFTYGMHFCANIVTGSEGRSDAVLLRAGEVVAGAGLARERRPGAREVDLARGPARLARCLDLDRGKDGLDLFAGPPLLVPGPPVPEDLIRRGPRVGVAGPGGDAAAYPWRFWIDGEPTVSQYRPAKPRRKHV